MRVQSIANRIREGLELRNLTQQELCDKTGISKGQLSSYINGRYEPRQDNIYLISKALDVSPAWLMGYDVIKHSSVKIPLVGQIAGGTPILAEENIEDYFTIDSRVHADFCLRVKGDSMIDEGINTGDIVFIKVQPTLENGEIGAIIIEGEATLKRFYKNNGQIILQPANVNHQPIILNSGNVRIAGKLVAVLNIKN